MMAVTLDDIEAAAELLRGQVVRTPCLRSARLSEVLGAEITLKLETLQHSSSFKDRGALVKLASLSDAERRRGVVAMSAGNHAQGVAYHATRLGIPATIVMPKLTPFVKVEKTAQFGAKVVLACRTLGAASPRDCSPRVSSYSQLRPATARCMPLSQRKCGGKPVSPG